MFRASHQEYNNATLTLLICFAGQQEEMQEHRQRTEQVIRDTSKREAELLLRNSELLQEVRWILCSTGMLSSSFPATHANLPAAKLHKLG